MSNKDDEFERDLTTITPEYIKAVEDKNIAAARVACEKLGLIYDEEEGEDKRTKLRWSDFRTIMYALAKGDSAKKVANFLNIDVRTIYDFFAKNPDSLDDIDKARNYFNFNAEISLYNQAIGYYYTDEIAALDKSGEWQKTTVRKFRPASFEATRFYLMNRRGDKWKNKKAIDLSLNDMTDDDIIREARKLLDYEVEKNNG